MLDDGDQTAVDTVELLRRRLEKIEIILFGKNDIDKPEETVPHGKDRAVLSRLPRLESNLTKLASKSAVVDDLLKLYTTHPDLFKPTKLATVPASLTTSEVLAIINSCATSFPTAASQLTAINDTPVLSAESVVPLKALHPRIARAELRQDSQAREIAELRKRSTSAIQRWYELEVLGRSECWTEWEGRIKAVENRVRRGETVKAQEAAAIEAYQC